MAPSGLGAHPHKEADILPTPCEVRGAARPWMFADVLLANATRGGTLLDVGCGNGVALVPLVPRFDCVIAVDPDKAMLAAARETFRKRGLRNVKVCAGRWQALPVRDASVEVVSSMFSGVHAAEAYRVLKPEGLLVMECAGPPDVEGPPGRRAPSGHDPQSASMEFAATLYASLRRYFEQVGIRHARWPDEARPAELTGETSVRWDAAPSVPATPARPARGAPRMRFIAVCRKTG